MKTSMLNYTLEIKPDIKTFKFSGIETITLELEKGTGKIALNSAELEIKKLEIRQKSRIIPSKFRLEKENEELIISPEEKLTGEIKIYIEFTGTHNDQLVGFYRSKYTSKGKDRHLVTTQFEAADARRCFPCFDHPEKKATFDITLLIDKNLTAISNMPVKSEKITGDKKLITFQTTPVMSTYLVYLAAGEFEYVEDKKDNVTVRVYTTPGKKEQGRFALDIGKKFLKFYEDYFQIKYPLPKMDLIAIPDFAAGAMENWGAITFRENALLFDAKFSSTATRQRVAEVVAHEIAHQWFGNLVTMKWWNDLWLNESFATYMATKAVDVVFPEFDFWSQFLSDSTEAALSLDSLKSSHPIEAKVKTPKEIAEIFDDISYDKGGSILRMLNDYIGEKFFIEGIKDYLNSHRYSNSESTNLWDSFEKASGKPVKKMLSGWIKKTGYPMIEAKTEKGSIMLKQSRFLLEKTATDDRWIIPFSVDSGGKKSTYLMQNETMKIENTASPFKINPGHVGFFRVNYDKQTFSDLMKLVKTNKLSNMDRWGLQNDFISLCVSGDNSIKDYLNLLQYYYEDKDFLVLSDIQDNLYSLFAMSNDEKFNPQIKEHSRLFVKRNFDLLGWDPKANEPHTYPLLRAKTISFLGKLGEPTIISESKKRFESYLKSASLLPPDLQGAVFYVCGWQGNPELYNTFMKLYKKAGTQEEKVRFMGAISSFSDKKLLEKTFAFMLSDEIRYSDMLYPLAYLSGNPNAREMLWPWAKKNWKVLDERLGETKMLLRRVVGSMRVLSDKKSEEDIKQFFTKNKTKGIEMALAQTLERIRINTKFIERMRKEFS